MVIYFSGTGNSEYAANRIAEGILDKSLNLFDKIKAWDTSPIESETPWVIVSPVYAWQLPHFLRDWLMATELKGNKRVYFVLTCGDTVGYAGKYAKKICDAKGLTYMGLSRLIMPENYIAMFNAPDDRESEEIVNRAEPVLYKIIERIYDGLPIDSPKEKNSALRSGIINTFFYKVYVNDRKYLSTDSCTGCGACVSLCPLNNIELKDGRPLWKGNCTQCMACICHCPEEAIEYGKISRGKIRYKFKDSFTRGVSKKPE